MTKPTGIKIKRWLKKNNLSDVYKDMFQFNSVMEFFQLNPNWSWGDWVKLMKENKKEAVK